MLWDFEQFGERTALIDGDRLISYRELKKMGDDFAEQIPERSLIFILCSNRPASAAGYTACINHGIVPLLLDEKIDAGLLDHLIEVYRPAYLWTPAGRLAEGLGETVYEDEDYELRDRKEKAPWPMHEDLALLINTSGSTGSPKLVRQTEKNLLANTRSIVEYLEMDETERAITCLPMNYVYGLSILNTHLYVGASIVMTNAAITGKSFWTLVKEREVTSFAGVPFSYQVLDKIGFMKKEYPSLRYMTQAGGKLPVELHDKFSRFAAERGIRFIVMYGASEATARMGYLPAQYAVERCGSMGFAIPGGRFEIIDANDQVITEPDTAGELVYYGDNVTMGYAQKGEDLVLGDENCGRLRTGDVARFDADGFYYIVGRMKRFVKVFGKRIGLDELELILKTHYDTTEVACGGKDEEIHVFVADPSIDTRELVAFASKKLEINPRVFQVYEVEEIVKNNAGKTLYLEMEKTAKGGNEDAESK